jgi:hypothetical protein
MLDLRDRLYEVRNFLKTARILRISLLLLAVRTLFGWYHRRVHIVCKGRAEL